MDMKWHDLLFIHYPVAADRLRALIPPTLEVDAFDGQAWIGIVPFRMSGVKPRQFPAMPWLSAFAELNVRTYVTCGGKPGVWFFSLDAANPVAVSVARRFFHLPYFNARMSARREGETVSYRSVRTHKGAAPAEFRARYRPAGPVLASKAGSLEYWLTERYCLYSADPRGAVRRVDIHHQPWPLQAGEAEIEKDTMLGWLGVKPLTATPVLHFARTLEVMAWLPRLAGD
jgi:uncharacterized protein YqjF (DUF2071 family)